MEFADIVINRIEGEDDPKKVFNALISFSHKRTGKSLGNIANLMICSKQKRSFITLLNLINKEQAKEISDENIYKANLFSDILDESCCEKTTVRTFVKPSDNYVDDVLKVAEEQECDLILLGIGLSVFNTPLWQKYIHLKDNSLASEEEYIEVLGEVQTNSLKHLTNISNKSDKAVAVLIGSRLNDIKNIFVPILKEEDILTFTYLQQIAKNDFVNITIWDSIGIIENNSRIQKVFNNMSKKASGSINMWNNNNKISVEFIDKQDLMIIGHTGWDKLISTPLCWIPNNMPSTLIIKDKKA